VIIEGLILIVGYYLFICIGYYAYGVMQSLDILGVWNFSIKDGYIGAICPYPRWTLFWLEWIVNVWSKQKEDNEDVNR
jgi:hypothetical protein